MATPAMRERAAQEVATPVAAHGASSSASDAEIAKWTRIIQAAGIKLD